MDAQIDDFIQLLACARPPERLFNPYRHTSPENAIRRCNLRRYLREMARRRPQTLLIGEAPGHRGCRLTGIPFTSEQIVLDDVSTRQIFGELRGYRKTNERADPVGEQSATIVWGVLKDMHALPLLWNALPFHPHDGENPWTNRTPLTSELALGAPFLRILLDIFSPSTVVGVGNKAAHILRQYDIPHHKVRHPSHGGKADFTRGIQTLTG